MKHCNHEGCTNPRFSKGYCKWHYSLYREPSERLSHSGKGNTPVKKKVSHISPISVKQAKRLKDYRKVRDEFMKDKMCEFPNCERVATDLHHSAGRVGKNLLDVSTFKALCHEHHMYIEIRPELARTLGLTQSRLDS